MEKKRKDVDPNKMDRKDDYYFQNWLIFMYLLNIFIIISIFIQFFFVHNMFNLPFIFTDLSDLLLKDLKFEFKSEVPSELIN